MGFALRPGVLMGRRSPPIGLVARFLPIPNEADSIYPDTNIHLNARIDAGVNPWGDPELGSSVFFDGTASAYLAADPVSGFDASVSSNSSDFCMEAWVRLPALPSQAVTGLFGKRYVASQTHTWVGVDYELATGLIRGRFVRSTILRTVSFSVPDPASFWNGLWHHIAIQRRAGVVEIFVDGVRGSVSHSAGTSTLNNGSSSFVQLNGQYVDSNFASIGNQWSGHMDEFRITHGSARYPLEGFSPPTGPFPRGADDPLWGMVTCLHGFDEDIGASMKGVTVSLTPALSGGNNNGIGAIGDVGLRAFSAVSQCTLPITDTALDLGDGDFTFEIFARSNSTPTLAVPILDGSGGDLPIEVSVLHTGTAPPVWSVTLRDASGAIIQTLSTALPLYEPAALAVVRDGGTLRFYAQGDLVSETAISSALGPMQGKTISFGPGGIATQNTTLSAVRFMPGSALYSGASYPVPDWRTLDVLEA